MCTGISNKVKHMNDNDQPLAYIQRTRYYYQKLGYGEPYSWAHYKDAPFTALSRPVSSCIVSIVTTAAPYRSDKGEQGPGAAYNSAAKFFDVYSMDASTPPNLRISHIAIDRDHTTAEDLDSYFPLQALHRAAAEKHIGSVARRFYGLPTNRSKRTTLEKDSQKLLRLCTEDNVDIALLVPNCPVCHQSVALAARTLEAAGIVTVIMGCAKDIVEHVGVPRFLFSDFPLGNAAGRPNDPECQFATLLMALELGASATRALTTVHSPYLWSDDQSWKEDYSNPDKLSAKEILQRREAFDDAKKTAKGIKSAK